jgi:hypothetical protein
MTSDEFAKILYLGVEIGWSGLRLKVVLSGKLRSVHFGRLETQVSFYGSKVH